MQPADQLATKANEPAVMMADSGEIVTYGELDERSNRLAQLLYARRAPPGRSHRRDDGEPSSLLRDLLGAQRSGLYITPINWHLKAEEAGYIIEDCGAQAFVTSATLGALAQQLEPYLRGVTTRLAVDGDVPGYDRYEGASSAVSRPASRRETEGMYMFYSSGTTGRPKGIKPPLGDQPFGAAAAAVLIGLIQFIYGLTPTPSTCARLRSTTPPRSAGPPPCSGSAATVVVMEKFDPARALELIEQHRVTHAQFVPTHFVRMLKLTRTSARSTTSRACRWPCTPPRRAPSTSRSA